MKIANEAAPNTALTGLPLCGLRRTRRAPRQITPGRKERDPSTGSGQAARRFAYAFLGAGSELEQFSVSERFLPQPYPEGA